MEKNNNIKSPFRNGKREEFLKKYKTIGANNDERIENIEKKVNDLNITLHEANSVPSIARNAFINYIVMYILLAVIIILHISLLLRPACQKMDAFTTKNENTCTSCQ